MRRSSSSPRVMVAVPIRGRWLGGVKGFWASWGAFGMWSADVLLVPVLGSDRAACMGSAVEVCGLQQRARACLLHLERGFC